MALVALYSSLRVARAVGAARATDGTRHRKNDNRVSPEEGEVASEIEASEVTLPSDKAICLSAVLLGPHRPARWRVARCALRVAHIVRCARLVARCSVRVCALLVVRDS